MAMKKQAQVQDNEQFKKDIAIARGYVSAELKKNGIDVDTRLLTTISVLTSVSLKYIKKEIDADEARSSFDNAINMYRNNNLPF
jgi:hypothetical protein